MADESGQTIIIKTAMMAFFLLLWILGQSQETKEGVQRYFNDPLKYLFGSESIFTGLFDGGKGKQAVNAEQTGGFTDSTKAGGLSRMHLLATKIEDGMQPFEPEVFGFRSHPDRIQFAITAQSMFSPGSALLRAESEPLLNRIANLLKPINAHIMIEAHTDDLPVESPQFETNWELSAARAATVVRYFIEGHQFDPAKITAMAASAYRPVADNRTPEGRAKNRRVDVYVIPDAENRFNFRKPANEN